MIRCKVIFTSFKHLMTLKIKDDKIILQKLYFRQYYMIRKVELQGYVCGLQDPDLGGSATLVLDMIHNMCGNGNTCYQVFRYFTDWPRCRSRISGKAFCWTFKHHLTHHYPSFQFFKLWKTIRWHSFCAIFGSYLLGRFKLY